MALTETEIKRATLPRGKTMLKIYDRESRGDVNGVPGLLLLITDTGSKLWKLKYRISGKEKQVALGQYPAVDLKAARKAALAKREIIDKGIDPMAKIDTTGTEQANSFKSVALQWHKWWAAGVDTDTAGYILRRLESDVFPVLGHKLPDSITPADVRNLIKDIETGKGARRFKGKGARDVAQRQHGTISQIFRYAVVHDLATTNPAATFKPSDVLSPRKTQHRAHIEPSELPALLVAIDDYKGHLVWRYALQLMSMLFCRTSELLQAPKSEFDLDNARWIITSERMKMDKPHIVPLPRQAVVMLRELFALAGDKKFVFPGMNKQTENGTLNENTLLTVLDELGYKGIQTGHGFRSLARTILAENGFDKAHVELQLSHSNGDKVEAAYNHALYLPQRTELMQWWADYLDTQLEKGRATVAA